MQSACAQAVIDAQQTSKKPVLTCWMGAQQVEAAHRLFSQHHVSNFASPESCVEAFAYLASHYQNQQLLMQVPGPLAKRSEPDVDGARLIIESVLADKRSVLSMSESKALLHAFAIPVTLSIECDSANEALVAADSMDFPVAMKINSADITHKSDVGGIRLNISNAQAVRQTYHELLEQVQSRYPEAKIKGVTIESMYRARTWPGTADRRRSATRYLGLRLPSAREVCR